MNQVVSLNWNIPIIFIAVFLSICNFHYFLPCLFSFVCNFCLSFSNLFPCLSFHHPRLNAHETDYNERRTTDMLWALTYVHERAPLIENNMKTQRFFPWSLYIHTVYIDQQESPCKLKTDVYLTANDLSTVLAYLYGGRILIGKYRGGSISLWFDFQE